MVDEEVGVCEEVCKEGVGLMSLMILSIVIDDVIELVNG